MRGTGPFLFTQVTHGIGIPEIVRHILSARAAALQPAQA
jgi:hypothetical protein